MTITSFGPMLNRDRMPPIHSTVTIAEAIPANDPSGALKRRLKETVHFFDIWPSTGLPMIRPASFLLR